MRILLTNDDGIKAPGLERLWNLISNLQGIDEIWVVAPQFDQSSHGHAITDHKALKIERFGDTIFSVDGTPADCILAALNVLMKNNPPDLVFSGINHGANLDIDVYSSGTIAAAREATLGGIKSMAISQALPSIEVPQQIESPVFVDFIQQWVNSSHSNLDWFLNVNLPFTPAKGIKYVAPQTKNHPEVTLTGDYVYIDWGITDKYKSEYLDDGYMTVCPLNIDAVDHLALKNFIDLS